MVLNSRVVVGVAEVSANLCQFVACNPERLPSDRVLYLLFCFPFQQIRRLALCLCTVFCFPLPLPLPPSSSSSSSATGPRPPFYYTNSFYSSSEEDSSSSESDVIVPDLHPHLQ